MRNARTLAVPGGIGIYSLDIVGATVKTVASFAAAIVSASSYAIGNCCTRRAGQEEAQIETPAVLLRDIAEEWAALTDREVLLRVAEVKTVPSKNRTARQQLIAKCGTELQRIAKFDRDLLASMKVLVDSHHVSLKHTQHLDQKGYYVNIQDGKVVPCTISDWLEKGIFVERSLVLFGRAGCAKTPVAAKLCQMLAVARQVGYYVRVNTVDSLRCGAKGCVACRAAHKRVPIHTPSTVNMPM